MPARKKTSAATSVQTDTQYGTLDKSETTQAEQAETGEALLNIGIIPNPAQLDAMGIDEATARGIRSIIWMGLDGDPQAQQAFERMIDLTDGDAKTVYGADTDYSATNLDVLGVRQNSSIFKFSELTEMETKKLVEAYREKAPIPIPETAEWKAKSMQDGYEQIWYKWNDGSYKYTARWHTRTSGAPEGQGNTWVIQRTIPGNGGNKPSTQFLVGENEWVEGWKWYEAIKARKNGTATQEQIDLLNKGHWKE